MALGSVTKAEWDAGAGAASDNVGGAEYLVGKLAVGGDGAANMISAVNALPVSFQRDAATHSDLTVTPLTGSATYTTATFDSFTKGAFATITAKADQDGTIYFETSVDNTNWEIHETMPYATNDPFKETHIVAARYWRVRFVNGASAQSVFRMQCIGRAVGAPHSVAIDQSTGHNVVLGDKTHNTSAPTAEAHEVIGAVAKAAAPTYTEGAVVMPRVTLSGDQAVTLDGESVAVTNAGTFAVQATLAAETTKVIGTINVAAAQTIAVTNAGTFAVQAVDAGDVAHDGVDSGNPIKLGAKAIGSLEAQTVVAANDRTNLYADLDGVLITKPNTTFGDIIADRVADTAGTSAAFTNHGAGGAGVRNYVSTISIFNSSATDGYVDFRDGTAGAIIFTAPAPKGGGSIITLPVPLRQPTANTALAYDVSGALTTVYISIVGFQSKA